MTGTVATFENPPPVRWKSRVHRVRTPEVGAAGIAATTSALVPGGRRISPELYFVTQAPWVPPSPTTLSSRPPSPPTRTSGTCPPAGVVRRSRK